MVQFNSITEGNIRALATEQSFERGYRYYRSGAVFDVIRRGNLITAKVEGSDYEPYQIQVSITETGISKTLCSCPYDWGGICKHIVAVLLVVVNDQNEIEERAEMAVLLADLTAEQLRQVLLGVAAKGAEVVDTIEREVRWVREQVSAASAPAKAVAVDINAVRREIHKDFRLAGKGDPFQHGYYDEYAGLEVYPDEIFQPHLDKLDSLLDTGDMETAVSLISAIFAAYIDGLTDLDDWIYEYNEDVFYEANETLEVALAEVLLSLDLKPEEQKEWLVQIADWEAGLGELEVVRTAVKHGWTYAPLVSAMQGNITKKGAWEDEPPHFADELTLARLRILARQNRTEEYINLAEAEGQVSLAVNMLAQSGDINRSVADAKAYLVYPQEALSLALILTEKEEDIAALTVAENGLDLEQDLGRVELARWIRTRAVGLGNQRLALKAAQTAFISSFDLDDYTAIQNLAEDSWPSIKLDLLKTLKENGFASNKVDIYLHENMLAEAMKTLDKQNYFSDYDLRRVIDTTKETSPNWGIRKCKLKAENIMDAGEAKSYETAVSWLSIARDIYQQHQRQQDWEAYLDTLLEKHHRKYKLVPMLQAIRT